MERKGKFLNSRGKASAGEKWEARINVELPSRLRKERGSRAGFFIREFSEFTESLRKFTSYGKFSFPEEGSSSFHPPELPRFPGERFNGAFCFQGT